MMCVAVLIEIDKHTVHAYSSCMYRHNNKKKVLCMCIYVHVCACVC